MSIKLIGSCSSLDIQRQMLEEGVGACAEDFAIGAGSITGAKSIEDISTVVTDNITRYGFIVGKQEREYIPLLKGDEVPNGPLGDIFSVRTIVDNANVVTTLWGVSYTESCLTTKSSSMDSAVRAIIDSGYSHIMVLPSWRMIPVEFAAGAGAKVEDLLPIWGEGFWNTTRNPCRMPVAIYYPLEDDAALDTFMSPVPLIGIKPDTCLFLHCVSAQDCTRRVLKEDGSLYNLPTYSGLAPLAGKSADWNDRSYAREVNEKAFVIR